MKKSLTLVLVAILLTTCFYSCEKSKEQGTGTAEFSVSLSDGQLKSGTINDSVVAPYQLLISLVDLQGNAVITDKLIPLYSFGTAFISEKLQIRAGEFKLIKFMVINSSGQVVYASPVAGSPLAYLSKKPLPFSFNIYPDMVTQVVSEVLQVGNYTPDKFGYAVFGVSIIKPLTFWAAAVIDNPMIMAPSPLFTEANLTITAKDGWHYTFMLKASVNQLIIRGGSDYYTFLLEKPGFAPQKFQFTANQLLERTQASPLYLKIPYSSTEVKTLVFQPGPDGGKDAMISQLEPDKNFGDHKYFEATFLTEPVLTVMRLNRSLIFFNLGAIPSNAIIKKAVLKLSYEAPVPWDSLQIKPATAGMFVGGALQQITEPWEENMVTWNKQPASTEMNQVLIYPFIRNVNFIEIDITRLIVPPPVTITSGTNTTTIVPLPNHGMKFKLIPENKWPGFRFASSDHPNMELRPKLTIYYTN
jgi:hypothetical protein